ncbi:cell wall-binding repeat-containing protein [Egibacter rhizosphaerae]|nr:cell wall-binding repeat-containing protein [Egibacter rhizosphaerae]
MRTRQRGTRALGVLIGAIALTLVGVPDEVRADDETPGDRNDWLGALNAFRAAGGLDPVEEEPAWLDSLEAGGRYVVEENHFTHYPDEDSEYYSEAAAEGLHSNLITPARSPATSIEGWIGSPGHAANALHPTLERVAYLGYKDEDSADITSVALLDVMRGRDGSPPGEPLLWPADEARVPLRDSGDSWKLDGCESEGFFAVVYPSGDGEADVASTSWVDADGEEVAHCATRDLLDIDGGPRGEWPSAAFVGTEEPLEFGREYELEVRLESGEELSSTFEIAWPSEVDGYPAPFPKPKWAEPEAELEVREREPDAVVVERPDVEGLRGLEVVVDGEARRAPFVLDDISISGLEPDTEHHIELVALAEDGSPVPGPAGSVTTPPEPETHRHAAEERVGTALEVADEAFPDGADTVVLVSGEDAADALAATPLAAAVDAPLLLTRAGSDGTLEPAVRDAVEALGADEALVVGGDAVVGPSVVDNLDAAGLDVARLAGSDRFATAALVADEVADRGGSTDDALLAASDPGDPDAGWPDVLGAGPYAALDEPTPILLTAPERLPDATREAVADRGTVEVVGGTGVVDEGVAAELTALGADVTRLAGADRYETNRHLVEAAIAAGADGDVVWLASGNGFADGLAAGAAAAQTGGVVALVQGDEPSWTGATRQWLLDEEPQAVHVVGGPTAVAPELVDALRPDRP